MFTLDTYLFNEYSISEKSLQEKRISVRQIYTAMFYEQKILQVFLIRLKNYFCYSYYHELPSDIYKWLCHQYFFVLL